MTEAEFLHNLFTGLARRFLGITSIPIIVAIAITIFSDPYQYDLVFINCFLIISLLLGSLMSYWGAYLGKTGRMKI